MDKKNTVIRKNSESFQKDFFACKAVEAQALNSMFCLECLVSAASLSCNSISQTLCLTITLAGLQIKPVGRGKCLWSLAKVVCPFLLKIRICSWVVWEVAPPSCICSHHGNR